MAVPRTGFSRMPGEENPRPREALSGLHSGQRQAYAATRFVFQCRRGKPMSGYIERVAGEIAALVAAASLHALETAGDHSLPRFCMLSFMVQ